MSKSTKVSKKNEMRYIELGLNISHYRKLRGYSQEELAERADLSRSYMSVIEAPNIVATPSVEMIFNIADALDIEPYELFKFLDKDSKKPL